METKQMNDFSNIFELVDSSKSRTSKYQVDPETEVLIQEFQDFLISEGKTSATSKSYGSYVRKTISTSGENMTSDMKSAVRKFRFFLDQKV